MQRYFSDKKIDNTFLLSKEDSYHINKVMRMKIDDQVEVVFNKECYLTKIIDINLDSTLVKIISKMDDKPEMNISVTLAQSLVKEQKMDFIIQKATELGVSSIIPLATTRSVVKENDKTDKKIIRWQRIAKEASEQSKRVVIPNIESVISVKDLSLLDNYDVKILCTVRENSKNIKNILSNIKTGVTMLIVVGPEGGFTEKEEEEMIKNGFITTSLGDTVLRTETVALFLMSVIHYHDMR